MAAVNELMKLGTSFGLATKQVQVFGAGGGIGEAPPVPAGVIYGRVGSTGSWVPTVGEANQDSHIYGRQNGQWVTMPPSGVGEAPQDGFLYARNGQTATWAMTVNEAAKDGGIYARQNGAWVAAPAGVDSVNANVTGGAAQGSAALIQQFNVVTSCPANGGVTLMTPAAGIHCLVRNSSGAPFYVWPPGATTLNAVAGPLIAPANSTLFFEAASATQWFSVP